MDRINGLDRERADARKYRGVMTDYALQENEKNAQLLTVYVDVCKMVLRQTMEAQS